MRTFLILASLLVGGIALYFAVRGDQRGGADRESPAPSVERSPEVVALSAPLSADPDQRSESDPAPTPQVSRVTSPGQPEAADSPANPALERLKIALEQEDPCLIVRAGLGSELEPAHAARALLETGGGSRALSVEEMEMVESLFKPDCSISEDDQNPTALAYRAYCLAADPESGSDAPSQMRAIWSALRRLEPRNGAHPFVWASYLLKRERAKGDAEARGLLSQAMQLERFDLKRRGLVARIRELGSRNSAAALLGEQLVLLVPQPDLATATEYWSEAVKLMPIPDVRPTLAWAQRSARRNWRRAQNGVEGMDWSIQEFESARKIGIAAWRRLRGSARLPEEFLREPMELIRRNPVESGKAAAMVALRSETCDRAAWDRLHEEQQLLLRRR